MTDPNTLMERTTGGLTVRLSWLPITDTVAINVVFDGTPMAVTVPPESALDAFQHPMIYLGLPQVAALGIK